MGMDMIDQMGQKFEVQKKKGKEMFAKVYGTSALEQMKQSNFW